MRLETIPLIFGIVVALVGVAIIVDAWTPDGSGTGRERRRRPRVERHRGGEGLIGLGIVALGAAIVGRDSWRYSVIAVIAGAVLLVAGALLNGPYVREMFVNRGPLRRRAENDQSPLRTDAPRTRSVRPAPSAPASPAVQPAPSPRPKPAAASAPPTEPGGKPADRERRQRPRG